MTPELAARARQRWAAWTDWYREKGYRAKSPGSNYHAGYLIAATMIAVAQAGEAGDAGTALWRYVADQLWNKDMAAALSQEGILAGGNWPEGWQYGPLSVAEIALGARVMREAGVDVPGIAPWLSSVMRHHVYSLTPADRVFAGGDTQVAAAYLPPNVLTLNAIALGDAAPEDKRWARGELVRLRLVDRDWLLYDALATVGGRPTLPPRSAWPTWYVSANTGTLYARTRWDDAAVWFASECHATIDTDHRHPNTGNFVLSRGRDDVIVDPTPYGSRSTLTSNAPTVASAHLPPEYIPSQGYWGETSGYAFVTQRESGVVAARCDYADQYKFQDRPSDAAEALRDFVLLPSRDGQSAALVVIDRARTGAEDRAMHLRFRTPGKLVLADTLASARVGSTKLSIASILRSAPGSTAIGTPAADDCFQPGVAQGRCDAARIPVTDYRVQIPGPAPVGVHLITVSDAAAKPTTAVPLSGTGWAGVRVTGVRDAVVVWRTQGRGSLHYSAPPGTHVVLDPPAAMVDVTARPAGTACAVQVEPGGRLPARPLVVTLGASCQVALDREAPAASAAGTRPARSKPHSLRSGCCGAEATPGSAAAMALVVLAILHGRRRRR
jgi:MYXO-CTERM domain-containing protein